MELHHILTIIGLSFTGQIMTNFDNLALLVALIPSLGRFATLTSFLAAQAVVLAAGVAMAAGVSASVGDPGPWAAILPIGIGVWRLAARDGNPQATRNPGRWLAGFAMFMLLTGDSFAVTTPLLADTVPHMRWLIVVTSALTALGLGVLAWRLVRYQRLSHLIDRLAPYAMIAIGIYIFINSATDAT